MFYCKKTCIFFIISKEKNSFCFPEGYSPFTMGSPRKGKNDPKRQILSIKS